MDSVLNQWIFQTNDLGEYPESFVIQNSTLWSDMQLGYAAIDMVSLPHGLYVVTLQANGMQETKKIIKA